jgi:hypothetical protein
VFSGVNPRAGGFLGLLDKFAGASAAYSLRKLSSSATNAVRIRRVSDSVEVDVGFSANEVNTNSSIQQAQLGSNRAGVILFDGVNDDINVNAALLPTGDFTLTIKAFVTLYPSSSATIFGQGTGGVAGRTVLQIQNNGKLFVFMDGVGSFTTSNTFNLNEVNTIVFSRSGNDYSLSLNANTAATISSSNSPQQVNSQIGDGYSGNNFTGSIQSLTVGAVSWDGTQSDAVSKSWTVNGSPRLSVVIPATLGEFITEGGNQDATVTTWYDQSGNAKNATQPTTGDQPTIATSGSLITTGGKVAIDFDGSNDFLDIDFGANLSQPNTVLFVHESDNTNAADNEFFDERGSGQRSLIDGGSDAGNYRLFCGSSFTTNQSIDTNQNYIYALLSGSSSVLSKNATLSATGNPGTSGINQTQSIAYSEGNGDFYNGTMQEFIVYNSDQSSNRTGLESNLSDFYNI